MSLPRWLLRALAGTVLAGWFGSWTLFALVIAPTAFQVLPSQAAAGTFVGPVLGTLHNYGIFAGIALALLGGLLRRGRLAIVIPVVLTALCAISEYLVTPAIAELQPRSFGLDQEKEAAERFSDLHQISLFPNDSVKKARVTVLGIDVNHDITSLRLIVSGHVATPKGNVDAIGQIVDQDAVSDVEDRDHRPSRSIIRLN